MLHHGKQYLFLHDVGQVNSVFYSNFGLWAGLQVFEVFDWKRNLQYWPNQSFEQNHDCFTNVTQCLLFRILQFYFVFKIKTFANPSCRISWRVTTLEQWRQMTCDYLDYRKKKKNMNFKHTCVRMFTFCSHWSLPLGLFYFPHFVLWLKFSL